MNNHLKSLIALGLLSWSAVNASTPAQTASDITDWYPVTVENRPFVRWWWLGSAVDPEGLTFNLEEFSKKGLGGVEITPIYGVKGNEANDIRYLSLNGCRCLTILFPKAIASDCRST